MSWGSLRFSELRLSLPGSWLAPIWIDSGAETPLWDPWEARRGCLREVLLRESLLREALSLFRQQAPGRSLEGFDVFDVDEASPDLQSPLFLQPPESPGNSLPVRPDHGAKVLMGVAGRYANLPWDLYSLALYEKEDEACEPRWHLL